LIRLEWPSFEDDEYFLSEVALLLLSDSDLDLLLLFDLSPVPTRCVRLRRWGGEGPKRHREDRKVHLL